MFQARRTAARKDAILEAEAQVWAVLGLEFHSRRIRSLWERWEALQDYVMTGLERCEAGDAAFTNALRDACRELNDVEDQLNEIMPKLGIPGRAQQMWSDKAGDRNQILGRIQNQLSSVAGADRAAGVFELIHGGADKAASGGSDS